MVVDRVVRVGGAALRMGGISGVTTHSAHRRRGYMRALMEDCLAYMERQGYDISLLDGIPDFYHRFGYVPVMPKYTLRIPAAEAEKLAQPLRVRRYKRSDLPALMALYRADNDRRTGTVVRTEAYWRWRLKRLRHCQVAVDEQGAVRGYVWLAEPPSFRVIEAAGDGPGVVESLLRFLARRAKAGYAAEIPLGLPPDHPFARRALALCGGEATMRVSRNGGWMGRFIGLRGSFERLAGELGERLRRSAFKDWRGTLRLATDLGTVELHVAEPGEVAVREETGGRVYLLRGPVSFGGSLAAATARFSAEDDDDWLGWALAAVGDMNADGYDDFAMGAYGNDGGDSEAGKAYLLAGRSAGVWAAEMAVGSEALASFQGEDRDDQAGYAVAGAGDMNGDGHRDLLIGARTEDTVGDAGGAVYLLCGPLSGASDLEEADAKLVAEDDDANVGCSLAGGWDVDGDGLDDILIGASGQAGGGATGGSAYLVSGQGAAP